jgi:opacity protein-like surface antigen
MSIAPRRAFAGAALGAALTLAGTAGAQGPINPIGFGVSAGAAVPTGDFGDGVNTGYSVDGIVTLRLPASPISFRGEVGYTRFGFKDGFLEDDEVGDVSGNLRFLSGVANVVLGVPAGPTAVVRPYLIGGVGIYNSRASFSGEGITVNSNSQNNLGFNGGAGIEIPLSGITGLGEVRFVSVRTKGDGDDDLGVNANHVAIRFGIRF